MKESKTSRPNILSGDNFRVSTKVFTKIIFGSRETAFKSVGQALLANDAIWYEKYHDAVPPLAVGSVCWPLRPNHAVKAGLALVANVNPTC